MFGEAFAEIATAMSAALGGPYWSAIATWPGEPIRDAGGSILTTSAPESHDCSAQVDAATDAMRADAGFVQGDVRLLVLAATLDRALDVTATLTIGDRPHADSYSILSVARDPLGITYDCRGRRLG